MTANILRTWAFPGWSKGRRAVRNITFRPRLCRLGGGLATVLALSGCQAPQSTDNDPGPLYSADPPAARGAVAADEPQAALIGQQVLNAGGNAVDAAVAMAMAMAATLPSRVGLGGGGICLVHDPATGTVQALDFLPRRTTGDAAAPLFVRGLAAMHAQHGTSRWEELVAPAERLARFGHTVSDTLAADLDSVSAMLARVPSAAGIFAGVGGAMAPSGQTISQTDLADTLALVRSQGAAAFTVGSLPAAYATASRDIGFSLPEAEVRAAAVAWAEPIAIPVGNDVLAIAPQDTAAGPEQARIWETLATGDGLDDLDDGERGRRLFEAQRQGLAAPGDTAASATLAAVSEDETAVACGFTLNGLFGTGHIAADTGVFIAGQPRPRTRALGGLALLVNQPLKVALFAGGGSEHTAALSVPLAEAVLARRAVRPAMAAPRTAPDGSGGALAEIGADPAVASALRQAGLDVREVASLGRGTAVSCDWERSGVWKNCQGVGDARHDGLGASARM